MALLLFAAACGSDGKPGNKKASFKDSGPFVGPGEAVPQEQPGSPSSATDTAKKARRTKAEASREDVEAGTVINGITDTHIEVVYYWKGDQTRTSAFLKGTGVESNVDEGVGFQTWIEYINKHAAGGGSIMGFPFNLHGRKLVGRVIDVGSSPEDASATAEYIASDLKPFAAVAAHGSLSAYTCPRLARAGVFSLATFNVDFGMYGKTNGYCIPSAASFDAQLDAVQGYLSERVADDPYRGTVNQEPRRFGLVYAEYPGLVEAIPEVVARLRSSGVNVVEVASVSASLTDAQGESSNVIAKFVGAGVNTVIIPDAGTPMSFTPAAESHDYHPDYFIWPCSGQDSHAMVRLYNANQWGRAKGLTCYDPQFMHDIVIDDQSRQSEWYTKYMSMSRGEPPAQAPYIYSALLPLVTGITNAGPNLNPKTFGAGLDAFSPYRYSGLGAPASSNMLLSMDRAERNIVGDFTVLQWSNTAHRGGGSLAGAYVFPENGRRYGRDEFR